jgi:glycosyltransferase involved in cell wall biosynthesis
LNVLAAIPDYPPASRVGAWLATHEYLRHLAGAGHTVNVVAFRSRRPGWVLDGVTVDTGIRGRTFAAGLAAAADVVVSHAGDGGYGLDIARRAHRPGVVMAHGHGSSIDAGAALAVFNSASYLAESGHTGPAIVCHPPVWPDRWDVDRSAAEAVTIVNLSRAKGIRTAWRLAEACPSRQFLGVRGGYGEQVRPRARNFEVIGTVRDMRTVYARTRVLLMPSAAETWGMVGVEAMASGVPVIAHPTPGLRESLGSAGIFVDRADAAGWVAALEALDDPITYATASTLARRRAEALHPAADLDRFASALELIAAGVAA